MTEQTAATPAPKREEKKTAKPTRINRIVALLRKHHRAVTFVGALIVFATFIFKEALRENFKDLSDSLEKAETLYTLRSEIGQVSNDVQSDTQAIRNQLEEDSQSRLIPRSTKVKSAYARHIQQVVVEHWQRLTKMSLIDIRLARDRKMQLFQIGSELAMSLPKASRDAVDTASLKFFDQSSQIEQRASECAGEMSDIPIDVLAIPPSECEATGSRSGSCKQRNAILDKCNALRWDHEELLSNADKTINNVLKEARDLKALNDKRYRQSTWISYILYALGSGLGLIGRLVGVETGAGG